MYAALALDESRAMGGTSADDWVERSRAARALKVAELIAERRIELYHSLQFQVEMKNRSNK